jgi:hypothetical protein
MPSKLFKYRRWLPTIKVHADGTYQNVTTLSGSSLATRSIASNRRDLTTLMMATPELRQPGAFTTSTVLP